MLFIIVTGSIMAVSILIIYRLCHHFGIELKYASLVLCAIMAFLVNAAAIILSSALDVSHLVRLGVMILIAAALVTLFNEHLLRQPRAGKAADEAESAAAVEPPAASAEPTATAAVSEASEDADDKDTCPSPLAAATAPVPPTASPSPEENAGLPATEVTIAPATPDEPAAEAQAQPVETDESVVSAKPDATTEPAVVAPAEPSATAEPAKAEPSATAEPAKAEPSATIADEPDKTAADAAETSETVATSAPETAHTPALRPFPPPVTNATPAEKAAVDAVADDIDALLDLAYSNPSPPQAIYACQQYIEHYPTDPMELPFMLSQLIRLYRELGDYQSAINTCQNALLRPIIIGNEAALVQFKENLHYLGLVKDILNKHNASNIPFAEIPPEIRQEIEQAADSAK